MENRLVFATNNKHKLKEVRDALKGKYEIVGLAELNISEDIPETANTLKGNAYQKASYILKKYNLPCFADDTGLEIDALNGEPGVYSARYAGENCSFDDNMNKVLNKMENKTNRTAVFKTVICLLTSKEEHYFNGEIKGEILNKKSGEGGFGYDPIFKPEGYDKSFAEISIDEKNKISHRGKAVQKLVSFLIQ